MENNFLFVKFERGSGQASLEGNLYLVSSGFSKYSPLLLTNLNKSCQ